MSARGARLEAPRDNGECGDYVARCRRGVNRMQQTGHPLSRQKPVASGPCAGRSSGSPGKAFRLPVPRCLCTTQRDSDDTPNASISGWGYSGGSAPALHRIPFSSPKRRTNKFWPLVSRNKVGVKWVKSAGQGVVGVVKMVHHRLLETGFLECSEGHELLIWGKGGSNMGKPRLLFFARPNPGSCASMVMPRLMNCH